MKRRDFLKGAASAPIAAGLLATNIAPAQSSADGLVPAAFRFANDKVPMNAANLCPMPTAISEAVSRFQTELDIDMSGPNRGRIEEFKDQARTGGTHAGLGLSIAHELCRLLGLELQIELRDDQVLCARISFPAPKNQG